MSREQVVKRGKYYSIVAGTFRTQVPQEDPTATRRDWESADGKKSGTKYERIVNALFGYIKDVSFADGEFGMQVLIKLDENEEGDNPIIALGTSSREAEDFLRKLPNVDLSKEVRLRPFNFEGDNNEEVRGMEIMQQDSDDEFTVKITNFFRDKDKKENINGYPNPEGDTADYSKDDWKIYFLSARKFLINYIKENICPQFTEQGQKDIIHDKNIDAALEENPADAIPF
jgi:hypothetical protein